MAIRQNIVSKHWPLFGAVFLFLLSVAVLLFFSLEQTEGRLIYALDDAYIHMAMAQNLVSDGIWGVTPYEFTSSSSSPVWTSLLALLFLLFGIRESFPFILNILFGIGILVAAYFFMRENFRSRTALFFFLVLLGLAVPLQALAFSGMEHLLHGFISLIFVWLAGQYIIQPHIRQKFFVPLVLLSFFAPLIRYESLFLIAVTACIFLIYRLFRSAIALVVSSLASVTAFGIFSMSQGGYFLPNSLLVKSSIGTSDIWGFYIDAVGRLIFAPHLLALLIFIFFASLQFRHRLRLSHFWSLFSALTLGSLILHAAFASTAFWFFRYDAYLIVLMIVATAPFFESFFMHLKNHVLALKHPQKFWIRITLGILLIAPLAQRVYLSFAITPTATKNIYEQHYQLGLFLKEFYQGKTVALNDIGAASFLSNIHLVDLAGLGSNETARLHLSGDFFQSNTIAEYLEKRQVDLIVVHDSFRRACFRFQYFMVTVPMCEFPSLWPMIGTWTIQSNVISVDDHVSFYTLNEEKSEYAIQALRLFSKRLPPTVSQDGWYLEE